MLVGNGEEIVPFKEEDYNTIVRFNWGIKDKGRTDVWVDALLQHEHKIREAYDRAGSPKIWRLNGESRHRLGQMPSEWYPQTIFIDTNVHFKMRSNYPRGVKPSIGYVCIKWLLDVQNEQDITITGFDSGESENRYTGETGLSGKVKYYQDTGRLLNYEFTEEGFEDETEDKEPDY